MSNHEAGENPAHQIPKVSHATSIGVGLVGPKVRPKGVADGEQVNIPVPRVNRQRVHFESLTGLCLHLLALARMRKCGNAKMKKKYLRIYALKNFRIVQV